MSKALHGTVGCYQRGCRKPACRAAWATYIRERRHRLGQQQPRARFYEGPHASIGDVQLTALAKARLDAKMAATGKKRHDVIEQLVREHLDAVAFEACC